MYVSLEDTEQRIQQRLGEVTGGEADKIWIATEAELLGKGFEQQLGNFLAAHPNVGFVIVDTLQRIRQMKNEGYSYGGDYEVMTLSKPWPTASTSRSWWFITHARRIQTIPSTRFPERTGC